MTKSILSSLLPKVATTLDIFFLKIVLADKGIITQNGKSGKRCIRVYPPWDKPNNKQAEKTQSWQKNYFLTIKEDDSTDFGLAKKLSKVDQ